MTQLFGLLALTLGGTLGQFAPPPPPPIAPVLYFPQRWFIPPHTDGDRDYKGHGPAVHLWATLYIHPAAPHEVWAAIQMDAVETRNDWTRASGVAHVPVARFTRPLVRILSPTRGTHSYVDTDHDIDTFHNPCPTGILNRIQYVGDTRGSEAGSRTGVLLLFNPILAR